MPALFVAVVIGPSEHASACFVPSRCDFGRKGRREDNKKISDVLGGVGAKMEEMSD